MGSDSAAHEKKAKELRQTISEEIAHRKKWEPPRFRPNTALSEVRHDGSRIIDHKSGLLCICRGASHVAAGFAARQR
jgi:hypothetical protein